MYTESTHIHTHIAYNIIIIIISYDYNLLNMIIITRDYYSILIICL